MAKKDSDEFDIGSVQGLTLPQSAVLLRDGFSYVLRVQPDSTVRETKVTVGQRLGDRVQITGGLDAGARVVASGGGFLADGDLVRVQSRRGTLVLPVRGSDTITIGNSSDVSGPVPGLPCALTVLPSLVLILPVLSRNGSRRPTS